MWPIAKVMEEKTVHTKGTEKHHGSQGRKTGSHNFTIIPHEAINSWESQQSEQDSVIMIADNIHRAGVAMNVDRNG